MLTTWRPELALAPVLIFFQFDCADVCYAVLRCCVLQCRTFSLLVGFELRTDRVLICISYADWLLYIQHKLHV